MIGDAVGGARITITDVASGACWPAAFKPARPAIEIKSMRTPRIMEEPRYSTRPSAAFRTTLSLDHPTLISIAAQGPLAYPASMQRASTTVLVFPDTTLPGTAS